MFVEEVTPLTTVAIYGVLEGADVAGRHPAPAVRAVGAVDGTAAEQQAHRPGPGRPFTISLSTVFSISLHFNPWESVQQLT